MPKRVAILISGGGSNMEALTQAMQGRDFAAKPALVLSNNADAGGLIKARAAGIATAVVDHRPYGKNRHAFEAELQVALSQHRPDILCFAGFMRILTPQFMANWENQTLNIHPSLLPKYPGLNTHQRALDAGDKQAGCTVHIATAKLDCGPILGQRRVPILPNDSAEILAARVLKEEHILYPAALKSFVNPA